MKRDISKQLSQAEVLRLLKRGQLEKAVQAVALYELSQPRPRGMNIDWKYAFNHPDISDLSILFNSTPAILKDIKEEALNPLRTAAAMVHLWGTNSPVEWIAPGYQTGIRLDAITCSMMLYYHMIFLRSMKNYKIGNIKRVDIMGHSRSCNTCKEIIGKTFYLADVPELPYVGCMKPDGCKCTTVAHFPND